MMNIYDLIVIGGGPSGMMAAGRAAELGASVLLVEKNRSFGRKLLLTGGGRCNITNAELDTRAFLENFPESKEFLRSPFSQFSAKDTFAFFAKLGLPLVVEEEKRAFPRTQRATDVRDALERYMRANGVDVRVNTKVVSIEKDDPWQVGIAGEKVFRARRIALATGGLAAPETGSTGDGFQWLRALGQDVHEPGTDLVPLMTDDARVHALAGVTLPSVVLRFFVNGAIRAKKHGKVLFTHFGISGPTVLNAAHDVRKFFQEGPVMVSIDMFPDLDEGALDARIVGLFDTHRNKELKNVLGELLQKSMVESVLAFAGARGDVGVHSVSREERKNIVRALKGMTFPITGTLGLDKAIVASGGIPCVDVDMRTMCSRTVPDMYVLGDMLDINRPSGGFSLQLCWTTGFVAGTHAGEGARER